MERKGCIVDIPSADRSLQINGNAFMYLSISNCIFCIQSILFLL